MTVPQYLKPNVAIEPLFNQWYAWWYLIAPATAPLFVANLHVPIMESFVANPELHESALRDPALRGGPYIGHAPARVPEVRALLERTRRDQRDALELAAAIHELETRLLEVTQGRSLEPLYPRVPERLRGFVELTYDLHHRASARFIEPLLYRSHHMKVSSQSLALLELHGDARPYAFSTPRLPGDAVHAAVPFRSDAVDALVAARRAPCAPDELAERLAIAAGDRARFAALFGDAGPRPRERFDGAGVRVRYFGHACVLVESRRASVLVDPVIGYPGDPALPRFTDADLPEHVDCVVLTHGHADHLMLETLLGLRRRIGTILVPRGSGGALADPSLKLLLHSAGIAGVRELDELERFELPGGSVTGVPFLGEHGDLNVRAKLAHLVRLEDRSLLLAADSNAIEPVLYDHVRSAVGTVDVLFIGMECEGAPMSWMYGPLLPSPLPRRSDQERRLNGCDRARALEIVSRLRPTAVYVYAMGREPWLGHVIRFAELDDSPQVKEASALVRACRERGITADLPFGSAELHLA